MCVFRTSLVIAFNIMKTRASLLPLDCSKCSPCRNLFSHNYGPCQETQLLCVDTIVLLVVVFLSFIIFIPLLIWFIRRMIKHFRNTDDTRYIIDVRMYINK